MQAILTRSQSETAHKVDGFYVDTDSGILYQLVLIHDIVMLKSYEGIHRLSIIKTFASLESLYATVIGDTMLKEISLESNLGILLQAHVGEVLECRIDEKNKVVLMKTVQQTTTAL